MTATLAGAALQSTIEVNYVNDRSEGAFLEKSIEVILVKLNYTSPELALPHISVRLRQSLHQLRQFKLEEVLGLFANYLQVTIRLVNSGVHFKLAFSRPTSLYHVVARTVVVLTC